MEASASESAVADLLEKISAGEGRFKVVPGQQLPAFADRKVEKKEKDEL